MKGKKFELGHLKNHFSSGKIKAQKRKFELGIRDFSTTSWYGLHIGIQPPHFSQDLTRRGRKLGNDK